jgi:hypothetical protein
MSYSSRSRYHSLFGQLYDVAGYTLVMPLSRSAPKKTLEPEAVRTEHFQSEL